jgi:type I restriction enzyme S subunit
MDVNPGLIPDGWEVKTLRDVCGRVTTGKLDANAMVADGDYPFFTCASEPYRIDRHAFDCEALLVSGNGANVGYVHYYNGKFNAYQRTYVISEFSADVKFIKLFLDRNLQQRIRVEVNAGNTPYITMGTLTEMQVVLPRSRDEQRAIAGALSDVDALLGALDQLIAKKLDLKRAAMQQLLTGKHRLAGFRGEWAVKRIGEFTDCTSGGTPSTLMPSYWGGSIPWMSSGELNLKIVAEVEGRITEDGLNNSSTKMIPKKCVLIGLAGQGKTRGTVAMNLIELCTNQSIAAIFPSPAFVPEYLYYNLDTRYDELRGLSTGDGGRGGLNLTIIKSMPVPLPTVAEQTAIAEVLTDMDAELAALEQRRAKTRALKQGMMQELLTGRTRLI